MTDKSIMMCFNLTQEEYDRLVSEYETFRAGNTEMFNEFVRRMALEHARPEERARAIRSDCFQKLFRRVDADALDRAEEIDRGVSESHYDWVARILMRSVRQILKEDADDRSEKDCMWEERE